MVQVDADGKGIDLGKKVRERRYHSNQLLVHQVRKGGGAIFNRKKEITGRGKEMRKRGKGKGK